MVIWIIRYFDSASLCMFCLAPRKYTFVRPCANRKQTYKSCLSAGFQQVLQPTHYQRFLGWKTYFSFFRFMIPSFIVFFSILLKPHLHGRRFLPDWGANPGSFILFPFFMFVVLLPKVWANDFNRTACIRHQCRKTTVLKCHRCLFNTGVEKMNYI
jgi:hypothetical protein